MSRLVGINHVALEVDSIEEALAFWERLVGPLELRGRMGSMAFVDMGDQFLALAAPRSGGSDVARHVGIVVDDKEAVRRALGEAGIEPEPGRGLRFADPWGNNVEVVDYGDVQFSKAPQVLSGMGLGSLEKTPGALAELREKGLET